MYPECAGHYLAMWLWLHDLGQPHSARIHQRVFIAHGEFTIKKFVVHNFEEGCALFVFRHEPFV